MVPHVVRDYARRENPSDCTAARDPRRLADHRRAYLELSIVVVDDQRAAWE